MKLAFIAALAVAALAAFFAVQNSQVATVTFLGWYFEASLVMVLMITFAAGVLASMLLLLPSSLKKSLEIRRLKSQIPPTPRPEVPATDQELTARKP